MKKVLLALAVVTIAWSCNDSGNPDPDPASDGKDQKKKFEPARDYQVKVDSLAEDSARFVQIPTPKGN